MAERVIFYYTGEDGTFLDMAFVTVFKNGVVEVWHRNEHVSTHIQNVEIIWKRKAAPNTKKPFVLYSFDKEDRA